jgi:hypothetical protein
VSAIVDACHWLAFTSNESGRSEVYIQAFEAGESPRRKAS